MQEVWQVPRYAPCNKFCTSVGVLDLIDACDEEQKTEFRGAVERISRKYEDLSRKYHSEKVANPNNTLAFNRTLASCNELGIIRFSRQVHHDFSQNAAFAS